MDMARFKRICKYGHDKLKVGIYQKTRTRIVNGRSYTFTEYHCAKCGRNRTRFGDVRGNQAERQWTIFFYLANTAPLFISTTEVWKYMEKVYHKRTIRRDIELLYRMGFLDKYKISKLHETAWRYIGPLKPFTKHGKFWCYTCKDFKANSDMTIVKKHLYRQCINCKLKTQRRYYKKNRKYYLQRSRKYYEKKPRGRRNKSKYNKERVQMNVKAISGNSIQEVLLEEYLQVSFFPQIFSWHFQVSVELEDNLNLYPCS